MDGLLVLLLGALFAVGIPVMTMALLDSLGWAIRAGIRWYRLRLRTGWSYALLLGLVLWVFAPWMVLSALAAWSPGGWHMTSGILVVTGLIVLWGASAFTLGLGLWNVFQQLMTRRQLTNDLQSDRLS